MSRRKVAGLLLLGLVVISMSAFCVRVLSQAGQFTTVKNLRTGVCQAYDGILAPEDIVIDHTTHTAFISSLDRKGVKARDAAAQALRGTIRALDLKSIKPGAEITYKDVTPPMPKRFHPLGLSLFTDKDGTRRLFVINQAGGQAQSVEIFSITSEGLVHEKSVDLGTEVIFANDVLAVGPDRFYVTDSAGASTVSWALNFAFQRKNSKIFYFDGKKIKPAAGDFVMANGIAMSKNGEEVYALDTFARELRFFMRNTTTGVLDGNGVLFIGTGVDNIDIAEDGSMWIAAHPKLIEFFLKNAGFKPRSSSQVIHAVPGKTSGGEMRTVYLDLGEEISGASVAVVYDKNFIIGSAVDNKLVICAQK